MKKLMNLKQDKKGFTLIELLLVLFLIGMAFVAPTVVFYIVIGYFVIKLFMKFISLFKTLRKV